MQFTGCNPYLWTFCALLMALSSSAADVQLGEVTKAQVVCTKLYKERQEQINKQITAQTVACVSLSNHSAITNEELVKPKVDTIRARLTVLRRNFNNCSALTNNLRFVKCIQNYNNMNMEILGNIHKSAVRIEGEINAKQESIESVRKNCIDAVIQEGTKNYTAAGVAYTQCMNSVFSPLILY